MSPRPASALDHADVGEVARSEQQARLAVLERRQALLEAAVDRHRAGHQARGSRAHAPAHRRVGRRLAHARVVGQPEVVVRAQQQTGLPSSSTVGPWGPLIRRNRRLEAQLLELVQALFDVQLSFSTRRQSPQPAVTGFGFRLGAPSGRGGTAALGAVAQLRGGVPGGVSPRGVAAGLPSGSGLRGGSAGRVRAAPRPRRASRPRASPSGCRGGGWRRCRAGARRSGRAGEHLAVLSGACRGWSGSCPSSRR